MAQDLFSISTEFHFKEYDSLKKEIEAQVEHSRKIEIYVVAGIAAFYAWFLKDHCTVSSAKWIPLFIVLAGAVRSLATVVRIMEIAAYLRELEGVYALTSAGLAGWETHLCGVQSRRVGPWKVVNVPFVLLNTIFWLLLVVIVLLSFIPSFFSCPVR